MSNPEESWGLDTITPFDRDCCGSFPKFFIPLCFDSQNIPKYQMAIPPMARIFKNTLESSGGLGLPRYHALVNIPLNSTMLNVVFYVVIDACIITPTPVHSCHCNVFIYVNSVNNSIVLATSYKGTENKRHDRNSFRLRGNTLLSHDKSFMSEHLWDLVVCQCFCRCACGMWVWRKVYLCTELDFNAHLKLLHSSADKDQTRWNIVSTKLKLIKAPKKERRHQQQQHINIPAVKHVYLFQIKVNDS